MLRWKDTCKFTDLHGAMTLAIMRAESIFSAHGYDCWITSLNDSTHMVGSKHYIGCAADLRVHHLHNESVRELVVDKLRTALGPQFTVLYEQPGTPNAHLHVQYNGA